MAYRHRFARQIKYCFAWENLTRLVCVAGGRGMVL
jgi:hypothetical protein